MQLQKENLKNFRLAEIWTWMFDTGAVLEVIELASQLGTGQGHPMTFFCKRTVWRSKYCLEISKIRERLKTSGSPFQSPKIFGVFLLFFLICYLWLLKVVLCAKKSISWKFRYEDKAPLELLYDSTATPFPWTFNPT